ncbi:MAG TPA: sugar phosphate isomerase/epimerase family protein [Bryobacteraceae bacterium]|nr:sugar phosphate isomerase/epimerase family protein [Bryobacteraceae bacterium]
MYTRRQFTTIALATIPVSAAAKPGSTGVMIGAQTYSFRDRSLSGAIEGMKETGLGYAEVWSGHIEPKDLSREELRKWRTTVSMGEFKKVRRQFEAAGIQLYAYNYSFRDDFSDEEIARGFEMARALGAKCLTASANVSTARRVDPFANKAKIVVGMHNHSRIRPNEFARPEDFFDAMKGMSRYIGINLDIGHFWGAGYDPVSFLKEHHSRIVTLHVKDKKREGDVNMPFGQGDTPICDVLRVLRDQKLRIPAMIEYEYKGSDAVEEVKKSFDFMKRCIA